MKKEGYQEAPNARLRPHIIGNGVKPQKTGKLAEKPQAGI